MTPQLIWDLPTRLFHWLFAAGFAASALIALTLDDDGPLFPSHAIIGLTLAVMVALRLIWGIIGTRYARFGSFTFGPGAVIEYLKGIVTGGGKRHIGHNPASAYAIFAMLALLAAMAATGVMLGLGNEGVKEIHEICAYALLGVAAVHVLGVLVHSARRRENITASMIHGRKTAEPAEAIAGARPVAAVLFLLVTVLWAAGLVRSYSAGTRSTVLPLLGVPLSLGEAGEGGGGDGGGHHGSVEHDED